MARPWSAAGIAVVSLVRIWTGADNLDSSGAIQAAITAAVPIALAGLSGLWSERAGVVNIGIEGMMILGTFGAGYAGYQWGPWAGVFFGVVCGLLGGLLLGAGHHHGRRRPHHLRCRDQHPRARA